MDAKADQGSLIRNELIENAGMQLGLVIGKTLENAQKQQEKAASIAEQIDTLNEYVGLIGHASEEVDTASRQLTRQSNESAEVIQNASDKMVALEKAFDPIHKALEVINGIADRTKLLALNATIQAAKAGEAGRNFAVVAGEIHELSKLTQETNTGIKDNLTELTRTTTTLSESLHAAVNSLQAMETESANNQKKVADIIDNTHRLSAQMSDTYASNLAIREEMVNMAKSFEEVSTIHKTFAAILTLMREQKVFTTKNDALALFESLAAQSEFNEPKRFTREESEYTLKDDDILISSTDTKGVITYANRAFYRIAGFEPGSLEGKPHNVIRHRDMPRAGFKHLWDTIEAGGMWQGIVCNRGNKGVIYWVKAIVFPVYRAHQIVGYISVRGKPSADEIRRAKAAYRKLP